MSKVLQLGEESAILYMLVSIIAFMVIKVFRLHSV